MPDHAYTVWPFEKGRGSKEAAAELAVAVRVYALPFVYANASLEQLLELIERGCGWPHQLSYRRPAVLVLLGDTEGAARALEEELAKVSGRTDPAATLYQDFAARFRARLT